jgi:hypothetical protein
VPNPQNLPASPRSNRPRDHRATHGVSSAERKGTNVKQRLMTWAAAAWMSGLVGGCAVTVDDAGSGTSGGRAGSGGAGGTSQAGTGGSSGGGTGGGANDPVADMLNDPAVQSALEEARDAGVEIVTHTERQPPDLTGYYSYALRAGRWIASGNGANVGFASAASEMRVDMRPDGTADTAFASSFDGVTPASSGMDDGYFVRGSGNEVTLYGRRSFTCDFSGADYTLLQSYIWTGTIDETTGDWLDQKQFTATTATSGELTTDCAEGIAGNEEVVGGWAVAHIPIATKITVGELVLMCAGEDRGYIPTETWEEADGTFCECTSDFAVACDS